MGYYNYLCELLRPLRVYRLDEGSLSGAELYAAGEGLDAAAEALEKAVREGVLMTAEDEGLSRRERLFSRVGARTTPALRRLAIASLLRVGGDGFTLEAVNQTISGCGVRAVAAETDEQGVVRVTFPQVAGEPEDFARIRDIILEIMPCHLQVDFYFRFLTWEGARPPRGHGRASRTRGTPGRALKRRCRRYDGAGGLGPPDGER